MLTVTCLSAEDTLQEVNVYSIDGTKLTSRKDLHDSTVTLPVTRGIHVVVAKYSGSKKAESQKVSVR